MTSPMAASTRSRARLASVSAAAPGSSVPFNSVRVVRVAWTVARAWSNAVSVWLRESTSQSPASTPACSASLAMVCATVETKFELICVSSVDAPTSVIFGAIALAFSLV